MLIKASNEGLFSGFLIARGDNAVDITHLQFANNLMIFYDVSLDQVKNIKRVFRVFELASGLQLNSKKSKMFGINVGDSDLSIWANVVGCDIGHFLAEYLGLPLGPRTNSFVVWVSVIAKFTNRLASWKANTVSYGETVVHLLFTCEISWSIWMNFASLWGYSTVLLVDPRSFLQVWHEHTIALSWKAPPVRFLKLNVDGAMLKSGLAGVKRDSKVTVDWILNLVKFPSSFVSLVREIVELILAKNFIMRHILRVCDVDADADADVLAKKGIR
ncbi:hypothetical protein V6N12_058483 [Hibiscus sabdariffa]|uniref:Reverse transcriptase domain-containing protein n=1 Tax=Hibiscus sabdariffa TaxID=183260 RepID=A0ABR2EU79_9ROSI